MRILYAHSFYRIAGGEDRHVRDQVALMSRTDTVKLIAGSNAELPDTATTAVRMLYSRAKKTSVGDLLDEFRPDIVHLHNLYPSLGPAVILAAHERNIPIVMTVHNFRLRCPNGFMFTEGARCRRCEGGAYVHALAHACFDSRRQAAAYATILWAHRFLMRLERHIKRFIVPSEFVRKRALQWGLTEGRVRLVRHFVNMDTSPHNDRTLGTYGAYVGRLSPEKGLRSLLTALRRADDPPFRIVGDGPQREALERLARTLGLVNTRFDGWLRAPEVSAVLSGARYVAIPSLFEETASLAALEALGVGRPLLVANHGALPELVATGAGLACRAGDEHLLSQCIRQLMSDDDLCRRSSIEAERFARAHLTPERHSDGLHAAYKEVLE